MSTEVLAFCDTDKKSRSFNMVSHVELNPYFITEVCLKNQFINLQTQASITLFFN